MTEQTKTATFNQCPRCQRYSLSPHCDCRRFRCWFEEDEVGNEEAATNVYADNYISAAEETVKDYWCDDLINQGDTMDVWASQGYNGKVSKFTVEAEIKVEYTAREVE